MAVAQDTYVARIPQGFEGAPANMTNWDADTRNCETAAGIAFGKACGQGSAERGVVLGGPLAGFVGISVRDNTVLNATDPEKYPQNTNVGVANEGDWFVKPEVEVTIDDPVHYDATTGRFKISGGEGPIVGARWIQGAAADGIAILRLSGHLPVP
jgi:hypothetical protein